MKSVSPKEPHVYIVEMFWAGRWQPTVGCGIDREQGRRAVKHWRTTNPNDKFRLSKYQKVGKA